MLRSLFKLSLIFIFLSSCEGHRKCEDVFDLFKGDASRLQLKLEKDDTRVAILSRIEERYGENLCYKKLKFDVLIGENPVEFNFQLYCAIKTSLIPEPSEITFMANNRSQILLSRSLVLQKDEIGPWIFDNFYSKRNKESGNLDIKLMWSNMSPPENIAEVLIELMKGLNSRYNEVSVSKFKKKFCRLNDLEKSEILNEFPFKLIFDLGLPAPPLPPPQVEIK